MTRMCQMKKAVERMRCQWVRQPSQDDNVNRCIKVMQYLGNTWQYTVLVIPVTLMHIVYYSVGVNPFNSDRLVDVDNSGYFLFSPDAPVKSWQNIFAMIPAWCPTGGGLKYVHLLNPYIPLNIPCHPRLYKWTDLWSWLTAVAWLPGVI